MMFNRKDGFRWEIPAQGGVPGLIYASEDMLSGMETDKVAAQVMNVAALPGVAEYSFAMPDAHWGYGFPIGGVAAMKADSGVISPGGVGYDIACGVRLITSALSAGDVKARVPALLDSIFRAVPSGVGSAGDIRLDQAGLEKVFLKGAAWAVENGYGVPSDIDADEDGGHIAGADPDIPSRRACERGCDQLGTLGSGNHFIEVQAVDEIYDSGLAAGYGLFSGQMVFMLHTGSRGCGYQICDDFIRILRMASNKYSIPLQDRQLACAPLCSPEGKQYFAAMCAAANYAKANRQVITHLLRRAVQTALDMKPGDLRMNLVYDVSHNIARMEEHIRGGKTGSFCVHRKGATRAFPKGHRYIPEKYRALGQPVLVPGSMGTASYLLNGTETALSETFGSVCHGAGRVMSRSQALRTVTGKKLINDLKVEGIEVRTDSVRSLAEETPQAYKDVDAVVEVCVRSGLAVKVARMKPIGVIKG